jgi:hypothetical protein
VGQFYFGDLPPKWVSFQSALTEVYLAAAKAVLDRLGLALLRKNGGGKAVCGKTASTV